MRATGMLQRIERKARLAVLSVTDVLLTRRKRLARANVRIGEDDIAALVVDPFDLCALFRPNGRAVSERERTLKPPLSSSHSEKTAWMSRVLSCANRKRAGSSALAATAYCCSKVFEMEDASLLDWRGCWSSERRKLLLRVGRLERHHGLLR